LTPLDESPFFREYDFPRDIKSLLEGREVPAIVHGNSEHVDNCLLFLVFRA
jgi:hypothetical protein